MVMYVIASRLVSSIFNNRFEWYLFSFLITKELEGIRKSLYQNRTTFISKITQFEDSKNRNLNAKAILFHFHNEFFSNDRFA